MSKTDFSHHREKAEGISTADILMVHGLVVTMDHQFRIFEDGALAIDGGKIVAVGVTEDVKERYTGRRIIDARRKLIMPGLINAHTHAPMNIFRGFADDLSLNEWLYDYIFPLESAFVNPQNVELGTRLAIAEMIRSGTTTFNDMYYYSDVMANVVDDYGIRAILTHALLDKPVHNGSTVKESLQFAEQLISDWRTHPRIDISVSVHAPYSASPALYHAAKSLADRYGAQLHTHLSETQWEFDLISEKYGHTPTGHLHNLGVLDNNMVAAHAIYLTAEDMDLLAKHDVGIAHNPQCNMKLSNGTAPIPELLKRGVRVGIGTDGVASNNDLDLFDEIRSSALAHKLVTGDPTVMDARTVLETVTIGGARLLRMDDRIGSLEAGKQADVIMMDLSRPHAWPHYDVYSLLVYSLRGSDVEMVMVDGRILMEGGRLTGIDVEGLYDAVQSVRRDVSHWRDSRGLGRS